MLGEAGDYQIQIVYTYQGMGPEDLRIRGREPVEPFEPWRGTVLSDPIEIKVKGAVAPLPAGPGPIMRWMREAADSQPLEELPATTPRTRRLPVAGEEESR